LRLPVRPQRHSDLAVPISREPLHRRAGSDAVRGRWVDRRPPFAAQRLHTRVPDRPGQGADANGLSCGRVQQYWLVVLLSGRGAQYLVDSNLDWGQDLKPLKRWMDRQGVAEVNLAYFGTADPAYYGIRCTYLNGSPSFVPSASIHAPRLPGYVAISATLLNG